MSFDHAITKAVNQYIQMEKDAAIMQLLRTGNLTQISNKGGYWRADTPKTFSIGDTLEEAVKDVLKKEVE